MADSPLLPLSDALREVLARVPAPTATAVPLHRATGLVLAEDVRADADAPPFRKAMMDGFAVRAADVAEVPAELEVTGTVPAGRMPDGPVGEGGAFRIMTGAPVPDGADAVVMVESTEALDGDRVRILEGVPAGTNIAPRGTEVRAGDQVLGAGCRIGAPAVAVLASVGRTTVPVFRPPRVGVVGTGDELVPADSTPGPGQIRNSNSPALLARLGEEGIDAADLGARPDDLGAIREGVRAAMKDNDFVILTGGVSMGDRDLVGEALAAEGVTRHFHKIRIKPGKPVLFGTAGETLVFGLPGNPVSVAVTFELLVRPALRRFAGLSPVDRPRIRALFTEGRLHATPREQFLPSRLDLDSSLAARVSLLGWTGSADLFGFARANALLVVPAGGPAPAVGSVVDVLVLDDGLADLVRDA